MNTIESFFTCLSIARVSQFILAYCWPFFKETWEGRSQGTHDFCNIRKWKGNPVSLEAQPRMQTSSTKNKLGFGP